MSDPIPGYKIERAAAANIHLLVPLYNETFGVSVNAQYLANKYTTPFTRDGMYYGYLVLSAEGKCVAHHTAIPIAFMYRGKKIMAAHSCDSLTAAEMRGKGVFQLLGKMTNELLIADGYEFIFGFSNENSLPAATKKLGWEILHSLMGYKIKVRTLPLEKICRRLGFLHKPYLALVKRYFGQADMPLPNSVVDEEYGGVLHDEAFFQFKKNSFNLRTRVAGVGLWFKLHGQLCIGDIEKSSAADTLRMLKKLKRKCFFLGITEIVFEASPGSWNEQIFARHYPSFTSFAALYGNFNSAVDFTKIRLTFGDLDSF